MSEKLKKRQLEILEDTVKYYSENVLRRCVEDGACRYSPESLNIQDISEGCAIGRLLPRDLCNKLDELDSDLSVRYFFHKSDRYPNLEIPQDILVLGKDFLIALQTLHDMDCYWDENGLSERGESFVGEIQQKIKTNFYS